MNKAFVLGAGLGKRLQPLTAQLPKPLIPYYHRPLICSAFDHVIDVGVRHLVVNTHHLPEAYARAFPDSTHAGIPINFRNESPHRLETAGGIANVRDLLDGDDPFLVYNGDILTDLPLQKLIAAHQTSANLVTLALRSSGPALHITLDDASGQIVDIHNKVGTGLPGRYLFTGIYVVSPEFFDWLRPGKVESVIEPFCTLIREKAGLGGVVIDEGTWHDLGERESYLNAHLDAARAGRTDAIHPDARIHPDAHLLGSNIVGPGAVVSAGATLEDCILWPNSIVTADATLRRTIVRSAITASGTHKGADL